MTFTDEELVLLLAALSCFVDEYAGNDYEQAQRLRRAVLREMVTRGIDPPSGTIW